ncbi:AhpC/TSA family protein [Geoalkalibacter ferrihydriticus]|uniref:AhpC/TSA family protein n=1 Tax=Geoalkalibacter ferrihydriticus TaxID=392333 RepID=A0A1G9U4K5_9BACT|nr:AhpC/TSA family protein [Geoalkalibacter ferrihydriticus]
MHADIEKSSARLVAISPMVPEFALRLAEKHQLSYPLLCDPGNALAKKFGIVHVLPPALREVYLKFGLDLPKHNGDESWSLPLAARYIVRPDGIIHHAHVDTDHTRRPEPSNILEILLTLPNLRHR